MAATAGPLTVSVPASSGDIQVRHACNRLLMVANRKGIELACDKCGGKVVYTWREILLLMLTAEMADPPASELTRKMLGT